MTSIFETLSELLKNNFWIAPIISLIAGILTAFTPCSLSTIPLIIGYVGGTGAKETKKAFKLSLVFALGMAITFTVLGAIAALIGRFMRNNWKLVVYSFRNTYGTYGYSNFRNIYIYKANIFKYKKY